MMDTPETDESYEEYYREISDGCGCTEMWEFMVAWREDRGQR